MKIVRRNFSCSCLGEEKAALLGGVRFRMTAVVQCVYACNNDEVDVMGNNIYITVFPTGATFLKNTVS